MCLSAPRRGRNAAGSDGFDDTRESDTAPAPAAFTPTPADHPLQGLRANAAPLPTVHPALTIEPSVAAPSPASEPARLPAEDLKLQAFSFFAKRFKLYGQLIELK